MISFNQYLTRAAKDMKSGLCEIEDFETKHVSITHYEMYEYY